MDFWQNYFCQKRQDEEIIYQKENDKSRVAPMESIMYRGVAPSTVAQGTQSIDTVVLQIKQYKELADSGIISEEDYNAKKKQLLGI